MTAYDLDSLDRGILYCLQENAREYSSTQIGEQLGCAGSTIRNRLNQMEEAGVIKSYQPEIDYAQAGFQHHIIFTCTAPEGLDDIVDQILDIDGVLEVRELLAGDGNIRIEAIGEAKNQLTEIADTLRSLGLEINRSDVLRRKKSRPCSYFGDEIKETNEQNIE